MKPSLRDVLHRNLLRRGAVALLIWAAVAIVSATSALSYFFVDRISEYVFSEVVASTAEAVTGQNLFRVQESVDRVSRNARQVYGLPVSVQVRLDLVPLAQVDFLARPLVKMHRLKEGTSLANQHLSVEVEIDLDRVVFGAVIVLLMLLGGLWVVYSRWTMHAERSVSLVARPLEELSGWSRKLASALAEAGSIPPSLPSADVREVSDLVGSIRNMSDEIVRLQSQLGSAKFNEGRLDMARQVAHDIRSPLAALQVVLRSDLVSDPEIAALTRAAVERIQAIAKDLLSRPQPTAASVISLVPLLERTIAEKRVENADLANLLLEFESVVGSAPCLTRVEPVTLSRAISNLLNNAIEAIPDKSGYVRLRCSTDFDAKRLTIEIEDSGSGMPPDVVSKLESNETTTTKQGGFGLGVRYAKTAIEGWGGRLEYRRGSVGTVCRIVLPAAEE